MADKRVLAFDFGASSGRAMLGEWKNGKIELREIHRFSNDPVNIAGTLHWDTLRILHEIKNAITKNAKLRVLAALYSLFSFFDAFHLTYHNIHITVYITTCSYHFGHSLTFTIFIHLTI